MPRPSRTDTVDDPASRRDDTLLRIITDKLPIGIAYVDPDRFYSFANQRFAAAYGLTPESIVGKHAAEFIWQDALELGDPFFEAAYSGKAVDFIHPGRHADGRQLTIRTFLRPDISEDGRVAGFYVCSFNVTREKEAETALLQAQKMDAVGQLASGIAHDFNNLLAVIYGNLVPLRDLVAEPALREEYLEPSIHAVEQGARLTGQLLAIARRQPLRPEAIDVEACVTDMLRLLRRTLRPDISVGMECRGVPPLAHLDRGQFETALLNLCLNARDAMPQGGRIGIEIDYPSPRGGADFVGVTISDTGEGISEEALGQIFEPFFTTKGAGQGTGLGLSMVWGFIRQSAGTIAVDSTPGTGSRFMLDLPILAPDAAPRQIGAGGAGDMAQAGQGLVLLVDDNHELRRTIRRQLAGAGYSVIEAESGEEALPLVGALDNLRALVSDVVMPGMSGFSLAREAVRLRPELRVILMTGYAEADEAGADGDRAIFPVLNKPFLPDKLICAIEDSAA